MPLLPLRARTPALLFALALGARFTHAQLAPQPPAAKPTTGALPVYIEEFFLSEAVRSEERGELQFTLDGAAFRDHQSAADGSSLDLDIEYGITGRLQLSAEIPFGLHATDTSEIPHHFSTASVGVLYQFIQTNRPFALSAAMNVNLPLNVNTDVGFEPELLVAKAFGKLQIHTSLIPEFGDDTALAWNIAAVRPFRVTPSRITPTLEYSGRRNNGFNSTYITPGIYKHFPARFEIGVGVPIGIGTHSSPVGAILKATWEFGGDDDDDDHPLHPAQPSPHR